MSSLCIFGSTARGRADILSDKDVLVVAPSDEELAEVSRNWCSSGWSVAKFTYPQILYMASRGSMFLQHLKREGIIVRDDDDFLRSVISRFRPRRDYENEICESFTLLSDVTLLNSTYWSVLCVADIAYGAIRNIAILRLASRGTFIFDYADLICHFARERRISASTLDALIDLRALKHGYRNRYTAFSSPQQIVAEALVGAEKLFGQSLRVGTRVDGLRSGYHGLRMLELYLVTRADPRDLDLLPLHDPLAACWSVIRDPRGYPKPRLADEAWLRKFQQLAEKRFCDSIN